MAIAEHQRNLSECKDGLETCNYSELTQAEAGALIDAEHQRNYRACLKVTAIVIPLALHPQKRARSRPVATMSLSRCQALHRKTMSNKEKVTPGTSGEIKQFTEPRKDERADEEALSQMHDEAFPKKTSVPDATGYSESEEATPVSSPILHGSSSENLAMRVAHPTRPAAYGPSSKTQACVDHKLVPKGGRPVTSSMPRWALSVAERRLIWLVKKHPKMDRHRLGLWTFLGNQYE